MKLFNYLWLSAVVVETHINATTDIQVELPDLPGPALFAIAECAGKYGFNLCESTSRINRTLSDENLKKQLQKIASGEWVARGTAILQAQMKKAKRLIENPALLEAYEGNPRLQLDHLIEIWDQYTLLTKHIERLKETIELCREAGSR